MHAYTKRQAYVSAAIVTAVFISFEMWAHYHGWQHWMAKETGSENHIGVPPNYNYESGFGSVFPWSMGIIGSLVLLLVHNYRKHNCHTKGCPRIGHYDFTDESTGLTYKLCRHCHPQHPGTKLTRDHITRIHEENNREHGDQQGLGATSAS